MTVIEGFFTSPLATTNTELILVWCSFSGLLTVNHLFPTHTLLVILKQFVGLFQPLPKKWSQYIYNRSAFLFPLFQGTRYACSFHSLLKFACLCTRNSQRQRCSRPCSALPSQPIPSLFQPKTSPLLLCFWQLLFRCLKKNHKPPPNQYYLLGFFHWVADINCLWSLSY